MVEKVVENQGGLIVTPSPFRRSPWAYALRLVTFTDSAGLCVRFGVKPLSLMAVIAKVGTLGQSAVGAHTRLDLA